MKKVVTFGEIMLKLSPEGWQRFAQASTFNVEYSGAEANVAVSLANYGVPVSFVSRVPDNDFGQAACFAVQAFGVHTDSVAFGGERLGIYFAEKGASQRASKVIYDRKDSAIATSNPEDFDWMKIFHDTQWFHFTGITPALSPALANICLVACQQAKKLGLTISCDLNYRSKLWTKSQAQAVMTQLAPYIDICIANESDIADVFGISAQGSDVEKGELKANSYDIVAQELLKKFGFKYVAITLRESLSASINNWSGMIYDGKTHYHSKKYSINIIDRIGSGDAFAGGLIYGFLSHYTTQKTLDFAVAASCLKHAIEGDFNRVTVNEVEALLNDNFSGRIQR